MRKITEHIVSGDAASQLDIEVVDEPGAGGACHEYRILEGSPSNGIHFVSFQNGGIKEVGVNGITHEALLAILIDRLRCFQLGPYPHKETARALVHVECALEALKRRTQERIVRGVEGIATA